MAAHRAPSRRDRVAWLVAFGAIVLSIAAYVVTVQHNAVLTYTDAISHLQIARRVLIGTSPGLAQLGSVWLPLPHLLMLPFVWVDDLYYNGFAGAIGSMVSFVITAVLIYKITYRLTDKKFAGVIAAVVFGVNVNMLYMQSTPMTEALLFCTIAAAVYCLQQWADTGQYRYLTLGGLSALLATLARYESWPILFGFSIAMVVIAWRQRQPGQGFKLHLRRTQDRVIAFGVAAFAGIFAWAVYNWAIFGSPTNFQNGEYAKPSLWVPKGELAVDNWSASSKTYWYAMVEDITLPILILAMIGLVCFLFFELRRGNKVTRTLPVLSLLIPVPFFILCLWTGQRPLHVAQVTGDLYNTRYGLIMLLPVAIFIGYLVGCLQKVKLVGAVLGTATLIGVLFMNGALLYNGDVITYNDPAVGLTSEITRQQDNATTAFKADYKGGRVLMETFGNERVAFFAVPSKELVYEGSYRQWEPALANPSDSHIEWIVTRCGTSPDKVCQALDAPQLANYELVYEGSDEQGNTVYRIYRHK